MANIKDVVEGFITVDEVSELKRDDVIKLQSEYQNQIRLQMALGLGAAQQFVGASENGVELIDSDGNNHLDMIGGVGVMTVGSANQYIWKAMEKFKDIPAINAIAVRAVSAALSNNIAALSGGGLKKVWIGTGGTEANEGAIKLARMYFKGHRHKFVALDGSYHGKTMGSVSITGRKIWQIYHSPVMPGVDFVPINDIDALDNALKFGDVAAFFIEPIQGEGGIHIAEIEYLQKARELCTKYGTLMVCDEIQCGMARTGKFWAYHYAGIAPDVVTFAKGFSGGYIPIGGYITTEEVWNGAYGEPLTAFQHTATFGDNVLGCAAGIAALEYVFNNDLMNAAVVKGAYLTEKLNEIKARYPGIVKEIRGKGLMIGIEFEANNAEKAEAFAGMVCSIMMNKYRVQTLFSANNPVVIRALPPLAVTTEQMDRFLEAFENAVKETKASI